VLIIDADHNYKLGRVSQSHNLNIYIETGKTAR